MSKSVLIIGGTRFFGRSLVRRMIEAGHRVTLLNRGRTPDEFGDAVDRLRADRTDRNELASALGCRAFDLVYDQMCYTPVDADDIVRLLDGRVGRYVMASTIEVYRHLQGIVARDLRETDLDLDGLAVDLGARWRGASDRPGYAEGKRQAEAVIARARFPWATVRIGHVLSGPDDFTGRLAGYVERVRAGGTLPHSPAPGASSFIDREGIADFLAWIGTRPETGAFNAASDGVLTALELHRAIGTALGMPAPAHVDPAMGEPTPFDYPARYAMCTARPRGLGYAFSNTADWLPDLVRRHVTARPVA